MRESLDILSALREGIGAGESAHVLGLRAELLDAVIRREAARARSEGVWQGRAETPGELRIRERDESLAAVHEARIAQRIDAALDQDG
ncbi:hypothetical protein [Brachybacterium phenoliresistens]|nr:hypothetical protein [Brachybacterium phenoliresistens]